MLTYCAINLSFVTVHSKEPRKIDDVLLLLNLLYITHDSSSRAITLLTLNELSQTVEEPCSMSNHHSHFTHLEPPLLTYCSFFLYSCVWRYAVAAYDFPLTC